MTPIDWRGDIWLGPDFALLRGQISAGSQHAHYAHQIMLAPTDSIAVKIDGVAIVARCLLISSMRPHAIVQAPAGVFTIFAEPRAWDAEFLQQHVLLANPSLSGLVEAVRACRVPLALDARVERALAEVDASLSSAVSARELASSVQLSLSQLVRLFGAQIGLSIRRLVLWRRLRLAITLVFEGQTLTYAAHSAGFADSAHFSRTMRATFGVRADRSLRHLQLRRLD